MTTFSELKTTGLSSETDVGKSVITSKLSGSAETNVMVDLDEFLRRLHGTAVDGKVGEVVIDLRALDFMNSSCFKTFVSWIGQLQELPASEQYKVRFVSDEKKHWQNRSLGALACFAVDFDPRRVFMTQQTSRVPEELLSRFRAVAMERLSRIDVAWTALVRGEADSETEKQLLRDVHTLKGDAKVVGLSDASLLCQRLEDLLAAARTKSYRVHEDVDIVVTMTIQFIAMLVRKRAFGGGIDLQGFMKQIEEVMSEWLRRSSEAPDKKMSVGPHLRVKDRQRVTASSGLRLSTSATNVYLEHLRQGGEARARIRDVWAALLSGVEEAHRAPIDPMFQGHVATARSLAEDLGKRIRFELSGSELSVGPETADVLGVVLLHALRNAVDHGIELPEQRARAKKPATGKVSVRLRRVDERIELMVEDDGAGVDVERVRDRAVERGLLSSDVAPHASDAEVLECVLTAGFSTRDATSEISGRGIGLDAARAAAAEHGGALRIETTRSARTATIAEVPDVRGRLEVLVFAGAFSSTRFALSAAFALRRVDDQPTLVLEDALRIPRDNAHASPPVALEIVGLANRVILCAGSRPQPRFALRRCLPPDSDPTEVVWVDGEEVVLVRPEFLHHVRAS